MENTEIIKFLKENVEPLEGSYEGKRYRCSAYLKDGTYLPCVVYQNPNPRIDQAIKRFKDERRGRGFLSRAMDTDGYREIVKLFTASGNTLNEYDVERVTVSPFAFPLEILSTLRGETTMAWTGFGVRMNDDKEFAFGTSFLTEFFQMPEGYTASDIKKILNHRYMSTSGILKEHQVPFMEAPQDYDREAIFRERPFFTCYLDGI